MVDLNSLNPQQREAVQTIHGPLLILAGAGTGKTRVITFRMAHMMHRGIKPHHILGVTFTNKAAREMKERVVQLVPKALRKKGDKKAEWLTISTFHSLGVRILRQFIDRLGYKRNFVIYSDSEQLGLVKRLLSQISMRDAKPDPQGVLGVLSRLKENNLRSYLNPDLVAMAQHIRPRYESALRACNAVDFDDLLLLTLKLLEECPDVLEACRAHYQYVMVDEYQDTNATQFRLVKLLTEKHRNLCVVGDDDQSIYGWRGAEIANLLNLESHFPEVKVVKLEQNYRSTTHILQAANAVIKNNPRRREKQLWSRNGPGRKIQAQVFETDEKEATAVVEAIEFDRLARAIPWAHQAILFRTNLQARPLETALRKARVRYQLVGGQSYFDRREIKDTLAYFKTLMNPHDDNSLLRIANMPARGLSDVTMERLLGESQERHCSVFKAMQTPEVQAGFSTKTRTSIQAFVSLLEESQKPLLEEQPIPLNTWFERFFAEIGYIEEIRRTEKDVETADSRIRNLKELLVTLNNTAPSANPMEQMHEFLEDITLDADRLEDKELQDKSVILITIHSCKGLEFPHVHVVGLEEGLLPHSRSKEENTLDEERRLFYVAITRAKETLRLSYCLGRRKYNETVQCHPSSFLKEVPKDLVEWNDDKEKKPVQQDTAKSFFAALRSVVDEEPGTAPGK